jgi:hypothetical protein
MTRPAALAQTARRYLAQGETVDQALDHAARRITATPADRALARRLLLSLAARPELDR